MIFKAAIFDMDGLLLDTERICMNCFMEAGRLIGYAVDPNVYLACIGTNHARSKSILIEGHGRDFPYEEISALWSERYLEKILENPIPIKAGALELLRDIVESGTPIALATSTAYEHAQIKLRNSKLYDYFDFIIGGDQVANGKPDPEIYLKAAAELNVAPSNCVAFEDSENGVRAALAAGIYVVQVPDLVVPSKELESMGHTILSSLGEFKWGNQQADKSNNSPSSAPVALTRVGF